MFTNLAANPTLSIVIPVYNEEDGLQALFDRLYPTLDALAAKRNIAYEIDFCERWQQGSVCWHACQAS